MFERPNLGKSTKRIVKGAILGAGLLAGEGVVNNVEAQATSVEQMAQEDSLEVLMERGLQAPGIVFEESGKLYVVVESVSPDLQISRSKAEYEGRILFAKYLNAGRSGTSIELVGSHLALAKTEREGNLFKNTVLMEMPKPKSE